MRAIIRLLQLGALSAGIFGSSATLCASADYDLSKLQMAYDMVRGDCRVGDDLTAEQSDAACEALALLADTLKNMGSCWNPDEVAWTPCPKAERKDAPR